MEIELYGNCLKVYENGMVLVKKNGEFVERKHITTTGYFAINLWFQGKIKWYRLHRIIAYGYLGLDIDNPKQIIDHIDRNPLNNCVSNLRIVTCQQNQFNTKSKGYYWAKREKKWTAVIMLNRKQIHLGYFETEDEASKAYQDAKLIYHLI